MTCWILRRMFASDVYKRQSVEGEGDDRIVGSYANVFVPIDATSLFELYAGEEVGGDVLS